MSGLDLSSENWVSTTLKILNINELYILSI